MIKIIDGKRYNTETATMICDTSNGLNRGDFGHESSALYATKKGSYFIAGNGGPSSRFATHNGNESTDGSDLIPLDREDAMVECERHGTAADIEELFADMIEDA